jgi:hypothetical protein
MSEKIKRAVEDLGIAAYLKMHAYKVLGKKGRFVYFELLDGEAGDFDRLITEYLNSEFHNFDHHLMSIKKLPDYTP